MDLHSKAKDGMFSDKAIAEAETAAKAIHKANTELGSCTLLKVMEEQTKMAEIPRFVVPDHLQQSFAKLYNHDTISVAAQKAEPVSSAVAKTVARDEFGRETAVVIQRAPSPDNFYDGKAIQPKFVGPTKLVELNFLDPNDEIPLEDGCGSLVEHQVDTRPINMNDILTKHKVSALHAAPTIGVAGVTNALQRSTGSSQGWEVHHQVQMGTLSLPKPQWTDPKVLAEQKMERAKNIEEKRALATEEAKRRIAERNEARNAQLRKKEEAVVASATRYQHLLSSIDVPMDPIEPLPAPPPKKTVHDLLAKKKQAQAPAPQPPPSQEPKINSLSARIQAAKKKNVIVPYEPIVQEPMVPSEPAVQSEPVVQNEPIIQNEKSPSPAPESKEVDDITTGIRHLSTKRERSPTMESPPPQPKKMMLMQDLSPLPSNLGKVSIAKLREYCIQREIDSSGTKKDIIERLKNFE